MEKIVVGYDGSEASGAALTWAGAEARQHDAELQIVTAVRDPVGLMPYGGVSAELHDAALQQELATATERLKAAVEAHALDDLRVDQVVCAEAPARALLRRAEAADLLVVGARGGGGFYGLLVGSVSDQCVHHAPCPVVVVPRDRQAGSA